MKFLLDVNALVAIAVTGHEFHERVAHWAMATVQAKEATTLFTCAVTEMGMLRIVVQDSAYQVPFEDGKKILASLRAHSRLRFRFLADDADLTALPRWVRGPKQITDGHLLELAKRHDAELATLDEGIPGGYLIPR